MHNFSAYLFLSQLRREFLCRTAFSLGGRCCCCWDINTLSLVMWATYVKNSIGNFFFRIEWLGACLIPFDFRFSSAIGQPNVRPSSAACTLPIPSKWTQSISRPLHFPLACANSFTVHRFLPANCLQNVWIVVRRSTPPNSTCPFSNDQRSRRIKIKIIETISVSVLHSLWSAAVFLFVYSPMKQYSLQWTSDTIAVSVKSNLVCIWGSAGAGCTDTMSEWMKNRRSSDEQCAHWST